MKKMLIKGFIFILIILTPLLYANYRYKNTNYYRQLNGLGKFRVIPKGIEVLNLGNSHEQCGIIYDNNIDKKGYNLALESQPFEYGSNILEYYSEYLDEGATVIIPISYFDWYYNYEEIFNSGISVYNERYYSILDKEYMMDYELQKDILYNKFPLLTAGKDMKYIFEDISWSSKSTYDADEIDIEFINYKADYKYKNWTQEVMATNQDEKEKVKNRNIKYLEKTINFCYDKGYKPVLVTSPITKQLDDKFSEEFKRDFLNNCYDILKKYPKLQYFNYCGLKAFSDSLELFVDADHLNTDGANAFSKRLFADLQKAGLL